MGAWGHDFVPSWLHDPARFAPGSRCGFRPFHQKMWKGEPLEGKNLLIWGEQGIGDEILFALMFDELIARCGQLFVECRPKLVPIFKRSFPKAVICSRDDPPDGRLLSGIDYQTPGGNLAWRLRRSESDFPAGRTSYLLPSRQSAYGWAGPAVGLSWATGHKDKQRDIQYPTFDALAPVLTVPGVQFINLCYTDEPGCEKLVNDAQLDQYENLDGVSALIKSLDLVIAGPNTVSILAAALGKPVWQFGTGCEWQEHEPNPVYHGGVRMGSNLWFPTIRRWERRDQYISWASLFKPMAAALRRRLQERKAA